MPVKMTDVEPFDRLDRMTVTPPRGAPSMGRDIPPGRGLTTGLKAGGAKGGRQKMTPEEAGYTSSAERCTTCQNFDGEEMNCKKHNFAAEPDGHCDSWEASAGAAEDEGDVDIGMEDEGMGEFEEEEDYAS